MDQVRGMQERLFMFKLLFCFFALLLFSSLNVSFAEDLKLSGIMNGQNPTAIINDQVVAVGDSVSGVQIIEIAADHVVCQGPKEQWVLRLNEEGNSAAPRPKVVAQEKPKTSSNDHVNQEPETSNANDPKNVQSRRALDQSIELIKQADALLKSPVVFERLYSKAAEVCDEADRQAQNAFRQAGDDALRVSIKKHIDRVRKAKQSVLKEKADFNTHIRTLISSHQIKTGMTARDVVSSWGNPLMQNRDGEVEKWVFQDNNGYQKELVFKDGILVGY